MKLSVYKGSSIDYDVALSLQRKLQQDRLDEKIADTLLLQEHPPTLTIGRNGTNNDILLSESMLKSKGITIRKIERGGDVTYHGPGQLVAYAIIHLYKKQRSLRAFVEKLEQTVINLLQKDFSVHSTRHPGYRGVWTGSSKISALGIAVKRGVTMHGLALNIMPDLSHFKWIIPCGISDKGVSSLQAIRRGKYDMNEIQDLFISHFCKIFGYNECSVHNYNELLQTYKNMEQIHGN